MKNLAFYLEYPSNTERRRATRAHLGSHSGNVVAIDTSIRMLCGREGFVAVYDSPNSPVNWGMTAYTYLSGRCLRVSEALARQIHPALFNRLDD